MPGSKPRAAKDPPSAKGPKSSPEGAGPRPGLRLEDPNERRRRRQRECTAWLRNLLARHGGELSIVRVGDELRPDWETRVNADGCGVAIRYVGGGKGSGVFC